MDRTHTEIDPVGQTRHADITRRTALRLGGGGLATLLLAGSTRPRHLSAQEATPTPSPTGATGTTAALMGVGQPVAAPGLELSLRRITIAPGGRVPAHSHPSALVIFVESGSMGYTTLGGTAQLTRAATVGTPTPAEAMPVGTEVILSPGDWLFAEDPQGDVRNAGDDDMVLLISGLTRVGEPFTTFMTDADMIGMEMGATPTP